MSRCLHLIMSVVLFALWHCAARGGSNFDCARASAAVDFVICGSAEAIAANDRDSAAWRDAFERLNNEDKKILLKDQRSWLRQYPLDCGVSGDGNPGPEAIRRVSPCIIAKTEARIAYLKQYRSSVFAPAGAATHLPDPEEVRIPEGPPGWRALPTTLGSAASASEKMRFDEVSTGGNCHYCDWVQATGMITQETPSDFRKFLQHISDRNNGTHLGHSLVALNSLGGSLTAAVELGELFRNEGVITQVAGAEDASFSDADAPGPVYEYQMTDGICESACFFAFVGGLRRISSNGDDNNADSWAAHNYLGIHRFTPDEGANSFASEQQLSGLLTLYLSKMGINPAILALAASVGEHEMRQLTQKEAISYAVINSGLPPPTWALQRTSNGRSLIASLKGSAEQDNPFNNWQYQFELKCQHRQVDDFSLELKIFSKDGWSISADDLSSDFSFSLDWRDGEIEYFASANKESSELVSSRSIIPVGPFDFTIPSSTILNGTIVLSFALGPKSLAVLDSKNEVSLSISAGSHAHEDLLPGNILLPWQGRDNITALLRRNCIAAGGG